MSRARFEISKARGSELRFKVGRWDSESTSVQWALEQVPTQDHWQIAESSISTAARDLGWFNHAWLV